jgi:hypothetical protein
VAESESDKIDQIFRMQTLIVNGLNLLLRQVRHLPMSELDRATIEAWSEGAADYVAKVTKQPPSAFDLPLDDRGLKRQTLGEMLRDEEERLRDQPQNPPDELS